MKGVGRTHLTISRTEFETEEIALKTRNEIIGDNYSHIMYSTKEIIAGIGSSIVAKLLLK